MGEVARCEWVIPVLFAVADERNRNLRLRKSRRVVHPRNRKWRGEIAESAFLHKAMELGLMVSKPWGDSSRYDFVVDSGKQLLRVQVKSTACLWDGRYTIGAHGCDPSAGYTAQEIDFLVVRVVPEDAWYVIPMEAFAGRRHLSLYPRGEHAGQYEKYREAWELLGVRERVS